MKPIRVPFEARECRTVLGKVIKDKVRVMIGSDEEVFLKDNIEDCIRDFLLSHMKFGISIVKAGDEVRVIIKHGSGCSTFRPAHDGDGVVGAVCTSYSGESLTGCAESVALHLAQIISTNYDDVPCWLPASKVDDYQRWCHYQKKLVAEKE